MPDYAQFHGDPRFLALRRRFRARTALMVAACLGWYLLFLLMAAFGRDLMAMPAAGPYNLALALALGQFASTFLLAWAFARYARHRLDPEADVLRAELDTSASRAQPTRTAR